MFRILGVLIVVGLAGCAGMPPASSPAAPVKLESETVTEVQRRLNERGFDAGPVDGIFGKRTESALREFEKSRGLPVDGVLDSTTYTHLMRKPVFGGGSDDGSSGQSFGDTLSGIFGGSAEASQSSASAAAEPSTTGKGAGAGAVIGGTMGYLSGGTKGAVIGAAIGALVGNFIEHQRVRSSREVYEEHGSESRVVLNDVRLSQELIQPGEKERATVNYDIIAPDSGSSQPVTHTLGYYHGDTKLATNTQDVEVAPGGYETVFPVAVPEGAEEGEYRLVARVQSPEAMDQMERSFRVVYALNDDGELRVASISPY